MPICSASEGVPLQPAQPPLKPTERHRTHGGTERKPSSGEWGTKRGTDRITFWPNLSHHYPIWNTMVPAAGLEPAWPRPEDFKSPVSTDSTTQAARGRAYARAGAAQAAGSELALRATLQERALGEPGVETERLAQLPLPLIRPAEPQERQRSARQDAQMLRSDMERGGGGPGGA